MRFIGILEGKVFDICSDLVNKRTRDNGIELSKEELEKIRYLETKENDIVIGDSWDFVNNISLKDSPKRIPIIPEKSEIELKIESLEASITAINERLSKVEEMLKTSKV